MFYSSSSNFQPDTRRDAIATSFGHSWGVSNLAASVPKCGANSDTIYGMAGEKFSQQWNGRDGVR